MIKTITHKLFSVGLAILVLFSTVSFTIEKHYCGDVLVGTSVFAAAENCGMEAMEKAQKKSCCKDEVDVVEGQDELKITSFEDLDIEQQQFLVAFTQFYINLFESLPKQVIPHKDYSPPNLVQDIQVLDQVFLI
ncbi:HYC_CC_PP family protein [Hyunsoonleella rubra]|uniref:Secreted protein n=1 Tax=Hyunsoonleella rubra TaxID=1737062 RepID=A0ABW5T915_9FLAO